MYDFHKTRTNNFEHVFTHYQFRRDQKPLLKDIRRKNANEKLAVQQHQQRPGMVQIGQQQVFGPPGGHLDMSGLLGGSQQLLHQHCPTMSPEEIQNVVFRLQNRQEELEDKIRNIENKNKDYVTRHNALLSELYKSREREQNLERLLIIAFTCLASMHGVSFVSNNREIMNSTLERPASQQNAQSATAQATNFLPSGPRRDNGEQIVIRNDATNDLQFYLRKLMLEYMNRGHLNGIFGPETTSAFPNPGGNQHQNYPQQILQNQFEQIAKNLASSMQQSGTHPEIKNLSNLHMNPLGNEEADDFIQIPDNSQPLFERRSSINNFMDSSFRQNPSFRVPQIAPNKGTDSPYNSNYIGNTGRNSPCMSPHPYLNLEDFDKQSNKKLFTLSEYSFDLNNGEGPAMTTNNGPDQWHSTGERKLTTPTKDLFGNEQDFSYGNIAKPSFFENEDKSDKSNEQRRKLHSELLKAFENYQSGTLSDKGSSFAQNHNVEFETLSNQSSSRSAKDLIGLLGKRVQRSSSVMEIINSVNIDDDLNKSANPESLVSPAAGWSLPVTALEQESVVKKRGKKS